MSAAPSCSSTRSALEAALSRATAAPTEAEAFPLFLEELRQAAPALVASESGRDGDDGGAKSVVDDDSKASSRSSLRLASPESRSAYDLALRSALSRAMASALRNGEPVMEHDASGSAASSSASTVRRLLAVASGAAAATGSADPSAATATLFSALEDLLEGTPVDQAPEAFAALEQAASEPLRRLGWDRCKLPLLRACNGLLARASRRRSPRDCGAVLLFLARAAPLGDKSGLNLMGTCNSASHPVPVEEVGGGGGGGGDGEGDGEEGRSLKAFDSSGERIDGALYKRFWELQRALQSPLPTLLVPNSSASSSSSSSAPPASSSSSPEAAAWAEFQASVRAVLEAFARTPVAVDAAGGSKVGLGLSSSSSSSKGRRLGSASAKRRSGAAPPPPQPSSSSSSSSAAVGVSYLSSPSIFGLQMRDGAVRRHFLVQVLIALHALRHPPQRLASAAGAGPSKSSAAAATATAAAATAATAPKVSPPRARQLAEAGSLESAVLSALELVPPEGKKYAAAVRAALAREGSWAAWKGGNPPCPSLERAPLDVAAAASSTSSAASSSSLPASSLSTSLRRKPGGLGAPGPPLLGTPDLDRLWSLSGGAANGEGLAAADRGVAPGVESFLEPVLSEMDPEEGIEDFYKTQRDQVYQWKALRQMAASDWRALAAVVASPGACDLEAGAAAMFPARVPKGWVSLAAKEEAKAKLKKEEEEEREKEEKEKKERAEREAAEAAAKAKAAEAAAKAKAAEAAAAEVVKEEEEENKEEMKEEEGTGGATAAAAATTRAGGKRKRDSDEGGEGQQQEEKEKPAAAAGEEEEEEQGEEEEEQGEEDGGDGEAEMTDAAEEEGGGEEQVEEEGEEEAAAFLAASNAEADAAADAPLSQEQQQQQQSGDEEGMEVEEEGGEEGALAPPEEEDDGEDDDDDDKGEEEPSLPRSEGAAAADAPAEEEGGLKEGEVAVAVEGGEEQDEG